MKCVICQKDINDYLPEFNQLKIDESKTVDICTDCVQAFLKWQQTMFAKLYPTNFAKKFTKKS